MTRVAVQPTVAPAQEFVAARAVARLYDRHPQDSGALCHGKDVALNNWWTSAVDCDCALHLVHEMSWRNPWRSGGRWYCTHIGIWTGERLTGVIRLTRPVHLDPGATFVYKYGIDVPRA